MGGSGRGGESDRQPVTRADRGQVFYNNGNKGTPGKSIISYALRTRCWLKNGSCIKGEEVQKLSHYSHSLMDHVGMFWGHLQFSFPFHPLLAHFWWNCKKTYLFAPLPLWTIEKGIIWVLIFDITNDCGAESDWNNWGDKGRISVESSWKIGACIRRRWGYVYIFHALVSRGGKRKKTGSQTFNLFNNILKEITL